MDANGRAIGVLGTGTDVCYPKENKKLYEKVLERGAIISEFPLRNRIVAGMPLGVVVEARSTAGRWSPRAWPWSSAEKYSACRGTLHSP